MFGKKDNQSNERVIYQAKPNLILGCKKAILGFILLIFVLFISGPIIQFIGKMQVYLISQIQLPLTRYTAIAVFVVILLIMVYIIWQIVGWYSKEYILTDSKIIVKSGVLLTKKNYMPYATIQDINTSQSIFARLLNVGSVSAFSAYDNNQIALENISNPSKVEEIIFSRITQPRGYYQQPQRNLNQHYPKNDYYGDNDEYYDDDVVITPIRQEEHYARREYEYYPEDLNYNTQQRPNYEYESYSHNLEQDINRIMDNDYQEYPNNYQKDYYHNDVSQDYSYRRNDNYQYDEPGDYSYRNNDNYQYEEHNNYYNEDSIQESSSSNKDTDESSERVIKRHFDKFKN